MTLDQFVSILQRPSLRGLTVPQPYASMIRAGERTIVVRPQRTDHRGYLLIQAGVAEGGLYAGRLVDPAEESGAVLALALLADCRLFEARDLPAACVEPGTPRDGWAWCLESVVGLLGLAVSARLRGARERQGPWTPTAAERRQIITAARRRARSR